MGDIERLPAVPAEAVDWDFSQVFVDWLHIRQPNDGRYQAINDGHVIRVDRDGAIVYETSLSVDVEGSFDSSLRLRVTPEFVEISGNPARFDREHNVLGFSFEDSVSVYNRVLSRFDLPPLVDSSRRRVVRQDRGGDAGLSGFSQELGFRVLRVDATLNICVGRWLDGYLRKLKFFALPRRKTQVLQNTVYFRSKWLVVKFYRKGPELRDHGLFGCRQALADWCDDVGLGRVEVRFNREYLKRCDLRMGLTHAKLVEAFCKEVRSLPRTFEDVDVSELSANELGTLLMWSRGFDVRSMMSRNTWFARKRRIKQVCGFDIGSEAPIRFEQKRERIVTRTPDLSEYPPEAFE